MATYDIWKRPTHLMSRAECLAALEAHGPIHAGVFTQKELEDLYESGLACLLPNSDLVILRSKLCARPSEWCVLQPREW